MKAELKIETIKYHLSDPLDVSDPIATLEEKAGSGQYKYLLAHAGDGVIWGIVENKLLELSTSTFPKVSPELRNITLMEARLFGPQAEWLLWRVGDTWKAREIRDGGGEEGDVYTEDVILWGTDLIDNKGHFSLVREADTGIRHAPPIPFIKRHTMKLVMRHYLADDEAGATYVKLSRLVDLKNGGK